MRKFALSLFVLAAFTATAATKRFESRSDRYALTLDVDDAMYVVNVVEVVNHSTVLSASFPIDSKESMRAASKLPDGEVRVLLRALNPSAISATLDVLQGETIIDSFATAWSLAPRQGNVTLFPDSNPHSVLAQRYPDVRRVGQEVKAPVLIKRAAPQYPAEALAARAGGTVAVEALIDRNGDVKDAVIVKDQGYGLGDAALNALKKWKFKPATLMSGEPVEVLFNLTINFKSEFIR